MGRRLVGLVLALAAAAGCGATALPRDRVTFAVVAGVYYAPGGGANIEAAMVEESEGLLKRAIADLAGRNDVDFVLVAGDLLARSDPVALDRAKALLADLPMPYYVVLGEHDGPGLLADGAGAAAGPPAAEAAVSRSTVIWAFQGHGFTGPDGYWAHEALPGLVLVGLDTVDPGRAGGRIDARQRAWLAETLDRHAAKTVILVGHHSLVPLHPLDEGAAWRHMVVEDAGPVREVLERHPNVLMVVSAHHHFAGGRVAGQTVHLASPSVSVWPLAYHLVLLTRTEAEADWVPLAKEAVARRAQDRLLASPTYRGVFPPGEDGDTACVRLFGGNKMKVYPLPAIRP